MSAPLLRDLTLHLPLGWTGVVGANGSGKTTLLKLAVGAYRPVVGSGAGSRGERLLRPAHRRPAAAIGPLAGGDGRRGLGDQGPDGAGGGLARTLGEFEPRGTQAGADRGGAVARTPGAGRRLSRPITSMPKRGRCWKVRCGIIAAWGFWSATTGISSTGSAGSASSSIRLGPPCGPEAIRRGLNRRRWRGRALRHAAEQARRQRDQLEREAVRRREAAARSDKRRSKRGLGKDNSERYKRNLARVSGKDGQSGRLLRQMDGRLEQARQKAEEIRLKKTYDLGIWLGEGRSKRDVLLRLADRSDRSRRGADAQTSRPSDAAGRPSGALWPQRRRQEYLGAPSVAAAQYRGRTVGLYAAGNQR